MHSFRPISLYRSGSADGGDGFSIVSIRTSHPSKSLKINVRQNPAIYMYIKCMIYDCTTLQCNNSI